MQNNGSPSIVVVRTPKTMDDAGLSELFSGFGTVAEVVLDVNIVQPLDFRFGRRDAQGDAGNERTSKAVSDEAEVAFGHHSSR